MSVAQRAATTLLGMLITTSAGCHSSRAHAPIAMNDRARIYATVLEELQRESRADWVLVDSLLPTDEIDAELKAKVIRELPVSRRSIDAFLEVQRLSVDRFQSIALPPGRWMTVSVQQLDSMRAAVRAAVAADVTPRGIGKGAFWQRWQQRFPGTAGYVMLSPASIDNDGLTALVHVRTACGSICGETALRRLRRDGGGAWHTTGKLTLSES